MVSRQTSVHLRKRDQTGTTTGGSRKREASARPTRDTVFRALGDSTRRAILDRLRGRERRASDLCEPFEISQPAVSQHLKVLIGAGLVSARRDGRQVFYALRPAPLRAAHDWLGHFEELWSAKLDALGELLNEDDA